MKHTLTRAGGRARVRDVHEESVELGELEFLSKLSSSGLGNIQHSTTATKQKLIKTMALTLHGV